MSISDSYGIRPEAGHAYRSAEDTLHYYSEAGHPEGTDVQAYGAAPSPGVMQTAFQVTGAAVSLALVIGIGVWGYGQVMRDVAGVPVVEALDGPLRTAPVQPGGQISDHAGLSVNQIKAGEAAGGLPSEVHLAPAEVPLAEEDRPVPSLPPRPAARPVEGEGTLPVVEASLTVPAEGEALSAEAPAPTLAVADADPAPVDATAAAIAEALTEGLLPLEVAETTEAEAGPGAVARSLRPMPRPARAVTLPEGAQPAPVGLADPFAPSDASGTEVASRSSFTPEAAALALARQDDTAPIPPGTRLVQFGAFDTADEARAAWGEIFGKFTPLMEDKARVLQQSEAGGRPFWRLRAAGFDDLAAARRFCAALVAERTDCIPVVAR